MTDWKQDARQFVLDFIAKGVREFSANDLWAKGLPVPADRRHLNGVLIRLEKDGLIAKTDRKVSSVGGHGHKIRVWVPA